MTNKSRGQLPTAPWITRLLLACGIIFATGTFAWYVFGNPGEVAAHILVAQALCVLLPVGLGFVGLSRPPDDRFAKLLIGTGLIWSVIMLAQSSDPTLYGIGRTGALIVEAAVMYLLLAFPTGRLVTRNERWLFGAAVLMLVVFFLQGLITQFPTPSPYAACGTDCPQIEPLLGRGLEPFYADVILPLRELISALLLIAVAVVLVARVRRAGALMRRMLMPVAAVAILRVVELLVYAPLRLRDESGDVSDLMGFVFLVSPALVTVGFAAGLLERRLFVAEALQRLTGSLRPNASAEDLRLALSGALEDPSLQVIYRASTADEGWVDESGRRVAAPEPDACRDVIEVVNDGRPVAMIVHDATQGQDLALVQAASAYALTALENDRLVTRLNASLTALAKSRSRVVTEGDRVRRSIERDIHDGAQQHLVAVRVRLALVAEQLEIESPAAARSIIGLAGEVDAAIDEVRRFARGVYPALLAARGLSVALRSAGRTAPLATTVHATEVGRYSQDIEATVYFACMEALQNASKHATGASEVRITLTSNSHLRFMVSDDGSGFDSGRVEEGAGLTNLRDRLAAVGGELVVESAIGRGTRISGTIPIRVGPDARPAHSPAPADLDDADSAHGPQPVP